MSAPHLTIGDRLAIARRDRDHPAIALLIAERNRLFMQNRGIVYLKVRTALRRSWSVQLLGEDDAMQFSFVVALRAVEHFKPWLGVKLVTYIASSVDQELYRKSAGCASLVHVPSRLFASQRLKMADQLLKRLAERALSTQVLHDFGREEPRPELSEEETGILCRAYDGLDARTRTVMHGIFEGGETMERIGSRMGITKERVRQIKEEGLAALRRRLEYEGVVLSWRRDVFPAA